MRGIDSLFISITGVILGGDSVHACYDRSTRMSKKLISTVGCIDNVQHSTYFVIVSSTYQHFVRPQKSPKACFRQGIQECMTCKRID